MRKNLSFALLVALLGTLAATNFGLGSSNAKAATIALYSPKVVNSWTAAQVSQCGQRRYHLNGNAYTIECLGRPQRFTGAQPHATPDNECGFTRSNHGDVILYIDANYIEPGYGNQRYADNLCLTGAGGISNFTQIPICVYSGVDHSTTCSGFGNWNDQVSSGHVGQYDVTFYRDINYANPYQIWPSNTSRSNLVNYGQNDAYSSCELI